VIVWLFSGSRVGSHVAERRAQQLIAASYGILVFYIAIDRSATSPAPTTPP